MAFIRSSFADQIDDEGLARRHIDGGDDPERDRRHIDLPELHPIRGHEKRKHPDNRRRRDLRDHQQAAFRQAIDEDAGG